MEKFTNGTNENLAVLPGIGFYINLVHIFEADN